jgi:hypothetical protein
LAKVIDAISICTIVRRERADVGHGSAGVQEDVIIPIRYVRVANDLVTVVDADSVPGRNC